MGSTFNPDHNIFETLQCFSNGMFWNIILVYDLPNNSRLRILGNLQILEKSLILEVKLALWSLCLPETKLCKSRYQHFLVLFNFTGFLYLVSNILSVIVKRFSVKGFYQLFTGVLVFFSG